MIILIIVIMGIIIMIRIMSHLKLSIIKSQSPDIIMSMVIFNIIIMIVIIFIVRMSIIIMRIIIMTNCSDDIVEGFEEDLPRRCNCRPAIDDGALLHAAHCLVVAVAEVLCLNPDCPDSCKADVVGD